MQATWRGGTKITIKLWPWWPWFGQSGGASSSSKMLPEPGHPPAATHSTDSYVKATWELVLDRDKKITQNRLSCIPVKDDSNQFGTLLRYFPVNANVIYDERIFGHI